MRGTQRLQVSARPRPTDLQTVMLPPMDSSTMVPRFDPETGRPHAVPLNTSYAPPHQTFQTEMPRVPRDPEVAEFNCCDQQLIGKTPAEKGRPLNKYNDEMAMLTTSVSSVNETAGLSFDDAFGAISGWSGTPVNIKQVLSGCAATHSE